jgi:uncharacterized protein YqjF (DUF2071 family)
MDSPRISMRWRDVLFASWPVAPETVAGKLPAGLDVDTFEGDAYLSVVPFEMDEVRPSGVPAALGRRFPELNLRTYVTANDEPGVYFFNLDAEDPLGVGLARLFYHLPYYNAAMELERGERFSFESERRHPGAADLYFAADYEPLAAPEPVEPDSVEQFLVERYRLYIGGENLRYADIAHEPWEIAPAEVDLRANEIFDANGFEVPDAEPHTLYSPGVDVRASWLHEF